MRRPPIFFQLDFSDTDMISLAERKKLVNHSTQKTWHTPSEDLQRKLKKIELNLEMDSHPMLASSKGLASHYLEG